MTLRSAGRLQWAGTAVAAALAVAACSSGSSTHLGSPPSGGQATQATLPASGLQLTLSPATAAVAGVIAARVAAADLPGARVVSDGSQLIVDLPDGQATT